MTNEYKPREYLPHQMRVIEEKKELDDKRFKLTQFFETQLFSILPIYEKQRLRKQAVFMESYSDVLGERIAAF